MRDDELRGAAFAELQRLSTLHGPEIPYRGGLDEGFLFRGASIPFLTPWKGIYRASAQEGFNGASGVRYYPPIATAARFAGCAKDSSSMQRTSFPTGKRGDNR